MVRVLYDLSATQPSPEATFHGGSEYSKYVFLEALNKGYHFDVSLNSTLGIHEEIEGAIKKYNLSVKYFTNNEELRKIIQSGDYQRFYSGMPYTYDNFSFEGVKFYMTIHGLRDLEMDLLKEKIPYARSFVSKVKLIIKDLLNFNPRTTKVKKSFAKLLSIKNKHIVTVSKHSLYSICNFFPSVNPNEITVCNSPLDLTKYDLIDCGYENYFLLVSGNRWVKNNLRAIKALDKLYLEGQIDIKTVVLGCESIDYTKSVENIDMFTFLPYVSKEKLESFFQNAYAFIYPTLNEGFGYPPLQAMKYNVPVLASAISSVPEVCRQAALYFNPFSISEISNRILQIVNDEEIRQSLLSEGNEQIQNLKRKQSLMMENLIETLFE